MEDLKNIQETIPSEEDDNYGGLPWFGKSFLEEESSSAEDPNETSSVPGGNNKPRKRKGKNKNSDNLRKSASDSDISDVGSDLRFIKVHFSDDEYMFLKALVLVMGESIGSYVRRCVMSDLKSQKNLRLVSEHFNFK